MKIFLPKFIATFLVLSVNILDVHASGCCTWNHIDCPSDWCSSSSQNCGNCGGMWADLSLNPQGCCTWNQGECGADVFCNSHPDNCEGQCYGKWITAISPVEEPTASPVDSPTASLVKDPTTSPIDSPTASPVENPTTSPVDSPTASPVKVPTTSPVESPTASPVKNPTASPVKHPTASPVKHPTSSPIASPTQSPVVNDKVTSKPISNPIGSEEGELTMWTGSHPGPLQGSSCEYAQPDITNGQSGGTTPSWLENYVEPKMYCAVSEDLFDNGVGCGKCYRISYDGNPGMGTDPGRAGSAEIQVVNSGAGGQKHFDCFLDAHKKITGTTTGIFKITYDEIPCKKSPLTAVVLDSNNAYYVKVLFAGGTTGVEAADITVGGIKYPMYKNSGATWAVGLTGSTQGGVQFDVTFADGSVETLYDCFSSQWPVSNKGEQCASGTYQPPPPMPTPQSSLRPTSKLPTPTVNPTTGPTRKTVPTVTPLTSPPSSLLRAEEKAMSIWEIFQGLDILTNKISNSQTAPRYALRASGGAASDVVSEGQGYALLVTGIVLASWDAHLPNESDANLDAVKKSFHGYFNAWKTMCQLSTSGSCQTNLCKDKDGVKSVCLPGWKMNNDLTYQIGSGAAPDGDIDAITGMIFAVKAFENVPESDKPSWYEEVYNWIDQSATAFMTFNVDSSRAGYRLVKLGSCWGGWEGNGQNPSYHSPGGYKMMRDFQLAYPSSKRNGYSAFSKYDWDELISTTYDVLTTVQCPNEGMVPNWARITTDGSSGGLKINPGSFSGSGTPQYEFGSEASRTIWRLAMDAAVYPSDIPDNSGPWLEPMIDTLRLNNGESWSQNTFPACKPPGMSSSVYMFNSWLYNAFIYGPVFSSLIVPLDVIGNSSSGGGDEKSQQDLLEDAADKIRNDLDSQNSYYPRCWILLSSLAVNGALESAGRVL